MVGPLEIAIVVLIALLILCYQFADRLPGLGRQAGEGARELKDSIEDKVGDTADPKTLGRRAGEGLREAREFRDALTGKSEREPAPESAQPQEAAAEPTEGDRD
jgi:Sec-independent protein translocase protein TatA